MEENNSWLILGTTEIWLLPLSATHFSELWASVRVPDNMSGMCKLCNTKGGLNTQGTADKGMRWC